MNNLPFDPLSVSLLSEEVTLIFLLEYRILRNPLYSYFLHLVIKLFNIVTLQDKNSIRQNFQIP